MTMKVGPPTVGPPTVKGKHGASELPDEDSSEMQNCEFGSNLDSPMSFSVSKDLSESGLFTVCWDGSAARVGLSQP
jgi:hypothetical protein